MPSIVQNKVRKVLILLILPCVFAQDSDYSLIQSTTQNTMQTEDAIEEVKETLQGQLDRGCGGITQLPSKGESIVLNFNLTPTKGAPQRCLWTLDASQDNKQVVFTLKITLLRQSPQQILDENTLTFTEWHGNKEIATSRISTQNSSLLNNFEAYQGFLSFNAKTMDSEASFVLQVDVLETQVWSSWSSSSATHTKSVGSASYSLPPSEDLSSIVINPQPAAKMTLTVDVDSSGASNPCETMDSVDTLEFGMDGVPKQLGRLCGRQLVISYETENPVAALFYWWTDNTIGRGVKLSWE